MLHGVLGHSVLLRLINSCTMLSFPKWIQLGKPTHIPVAYKYQFKLLVTGRLHLIVHHIFDVLEFWIVLMASHFSVNVCCAINLSINVSSGKQRKTFIYEIRIILWSGLWFWFSVHDWVVVIERICDGLTFVWDCTLPSMNWRTECPALISWVILRW
jgi:hypothetical protein